MRNFKNVTHHNELVHAVYTGPRQNPPWTEFLNAIKRHTSSDLAVIAFGSKTQSARVNYVDGVSRRDHSLPFLKLSPFTKVPLGEVAMLSDFSSDSEMLQSDFYRICLEPMRVRHMLGINFYNENDQFAYIRLGRSSGKENYARSEHTLLSLLFPHFHTTSEMITELHSLHFQRDLLYELLGRFGVGVVVTDRQLNVKGFNQRAADIVGQCQTLCLSGSKLKLHDKALRRCVSSMLITGTDAQTQELHLTRHGDSVRVAIRPQHRSGYGWETHDLCFYLTDVSSEVNVSESSLSGIYGLTPREARITKLLVRGRTVDEITQQEHITKNTAYTHIKSVFAKVGVSQQSALVSRIVASPVILG